MSQVTARPAALRRYADVAGDVAADLLARRDDLRAALDDLRVTPDWYDHVADVPPLDIDLTVVQAHVVRLGAFCRRTATAFTAVDEDGLGTADADLVDRRAGDVHPTGVDLVRDGDRWIVDGTEGHDHVQLLVRDGRFVLVVGTYDRATRSVVYLDEIVLTDAQAQRLTIRTGGGNDVIEIAPEIRVRLRIWTGDGDDVVGWTDGTGVPRTGGGGDSDIFLGAGDDIAFGGRGADRIYGGDGRDTIDGGDGDDLIVGGAGDDVVHGGRGDDVVHGGRGDDVLEGGRGDDRLHGGAGDDVLSGGRGDDHLDGGAGDDVLVGGRGQDTVRGGGGSDEVVTDGADRVTGATHTVVVEVTGEPGRAAVALPQPDWMSGDAYRDWLERIDADLELLVHLPSGNAGLTALDEASASTAGSFLDLLPWVDGDATQVVILPYGAPAGAAPYDVEAWMQGQRLPGSYAGPPGMDGDDAVVNYGTLHHVALDERPPLASLYHELAHSYDQLRGGTQGGHYDEVLVAADGTELLRNRARMAEINSVGHDLDGDGRTDTHPTGDGSHHPAALTENALRDDLGRPRRPSYTIGPDQLEGGHELRLENVDP